MAWHCARCAGANPEGTAFCGHCGVPAPHARIPSRTLPGEERRIITALFADVSGFTSLADRLDADSLHEVISPLIAHLAGIAERYGGFVAKYAGDAILVFFGAPVAYEDHATRAMLVALEMHKSMARQEWDQSLQLRLRIGINSGRVISGVYGGEDGDYSILGDAVNTAQRLEAAAHPGETYVGDVAYRLAQVRFDFESAGDLVLRGKALPVAAWRLLGERRTERAGASVPLVGRDSEVACVILALDRLSTGRGGVIAVTGEAGVGKTRVMEEVRDRARLRDAIWLETRCLSYGANLAYWTYADLLRRFFGLRGSDDPADSWRRLSESLERLGAAQAAPFFARLLDIAFEGADAIPALWEPEAFRDGLQDAFAAWILGLSADGPVVIGLEDYHWADSSTMELTRFLSRFAVRERVALCITSRPEGERDVNALVEEGAGLCLLRLDPFAEGEVASLVHAMLEGAPPHEFVSGVAERTGGNPFFVIEVVRALRDSGMLALGPDGWTMTGSALDDALPPTVEGVVAARIDRLPRDTAAVLQAAAVIGRLVRVPLLDAIAGKDRTSAALAHLVEAGFLDPMPIGTEVAYFFHHALVQEVAYARLPRRRRAELHRLLADAGLDVYGDGDDVVDVIARHLYLGDPGPKAFAYLVRAGERAKRLFANGEAIVHFLRAAELAPLEKSTAARLGEVLLQAATLHELRGEHDQALDLYTRVRDETSDLRAWRGIGSVLRRRGDYDASLAALDAARASRAWGAEVREIWLEQSWTLAVQGQFARAAEACASGLSVDGAVKDDVTGRLLISLSRAESALGALDAALEHGKSAVEIFRALEDLPGLTASVRNLATVHLYRGDLKTALPMATEALSLAERIGSVEETAGCLLNLSIIEMHLGSLPEAIAHDRRAIAAFERIRNRPGRATGYSNLADKLMRSGNLAEALAFAERAHALATEIGHGPVGADSMQTTAEIKLRLGRFEEAAAGAEDAADRWSRLGETTRSIECHRLAAASWSRSGASEQAEIASRRALSLESGTGDDRQVQNQM